MAWQAWKDSLCAGCGNPREESFAEPPPDWEGPVGAWEERYDAHVLQCDACAARDRKAFAEQRAREANQPPIPGRYYAVTLGPDFKLFA